VDPYSCIALESPSSHDSEVAEGFDQELFDREDMVGGSDSIVEFENWIADELPRTVVGDVTAALDSHEFRADF
jgi:hypothetical protein